jgi:hypothetical protein
LDTVEDSVGKSRDFLEWRESVEAVVDDFTVERERCGKIANLGDRILCTTANLRQFVDALEPLAADLVKLGGGGVQIGADFIKGMRDCLGRS